MKVSYSALETFLSCPLKYKFQEIDKIKTPKGPEAVFGTLIHDTLRFIHTGNFLLPTQKEALNHFSLNWNPTVFPDETSERAAFAQGVQIIQDYYKKNDPNQNQIVDLESYFTISLEDSETQEQHSISGFIDRIDKIENGYEVVDYKTSRKMPPQKSIDENRQLLIYLMALLERYPQEKSNLENLRLSLYFLRHGQKLTAIKTAVQLREGQEEILDIIHQIQDSEFEPTLNPLCEWCGYQKMCPLWKHKFKKAATLEDEEKSQLIEDYLEIKENLKRDRLRLKQLEEKILEAMEAEQADRLFGEKAIISKTKRKSFSYNQEKLQPLLEKNGKWQDVLIVSAPRLKKALGELPPADKKTAQAAIEEKESVSLNVKKRSRENE
jgi:RecB family exonuclease